MKDRSQTPHFRSFKERPDHLVREFREHVKKTGAPETFHGIHPGPINKSERFEKLAEFDIDRKKRVDGDMAYCPMCPQANKYLRGVFIYLIDLQAVAAIGHECAAQETRNAADAEYRRRQTRRDEEDYLLEHLPLVGRKLAAVERVRPAALEADRVLRLLRQKAPKMVRLLREARRNGGKLIVTETISREMAELGPAGFKGSGGQQTRNIDFGVLSGAVAVSDAFKPLARIDDIRSVLSTYAGLNSEEEALDKICDMTDAVRGKTVEVLKEADDKLQKFERDMGGFCEFFSQDNIGRINKWGDHPKNVVAINITRNEIAGAVSLVIREDGESSYIRIADTVRAYRL